MLILYRAADKKIRELELPEKGGIIGHASDNFIVLNELGISGVHAELSAEKNRLFIEDLQSLNGTYLNRNIISGKTEIKSRDCVLVGVILLRFKCEDGFWTVSAYKQDDTLFTVDETDPMNPEDDEKFITAVTVMAPKSIRNIVRNKNIAKDEKQVVSADCAVSASNSLNDLHELGKYSIIKKIGKGGMGVVFLAKHKVMNNYRALKVLPYSAAEKNSDFFKRFIREARLASEIRHPNIVGVMDAETDIERNVSYIVMEFIDGGNLRRILKNRKILPEVQALLIARSVAEALKAIWQHKIVHRDIKPDNIMFTRTGEVKLADLGIAKNSQENVNLTRNDMMIGTPAYLSPEQIENPVNVDIRSDIYSLGATVYEMLTGETPYAGNNTYDILQKMVSESIVDPRKKNPRISAVTAKIVMKMLQKNPGKRYKSPQVLLSVLNEVLQHYSLQESRDIVKSAVLGIQLPAGVKENLTGGINALLHYWFFRFRFGAVGIFLHKQKRKNVDFTFNRLCSFSLQFDPENVIDKKINVVINAVPGEFFDVVGDDGEQRVVKALPDGKIELNDLGIGEYKLIPHYKDQE